MPENCNSNDCPVSARVDALEKEFDRYRGNSSETHRQMFERIGALEQSGATLKVKLDGMDEKLDEITEKVNTLADKPAKRWDGLVDKLIWAVAGESDFKKGRTTYERLHGKMAESGGCPGCQNGGPDRCSHHRNGGGHGGRELDAGDLRVGAGRGAVPADQRGGAAGGGRVSVGA